MTVTSTKIITDKNNDSGNGFGFVTIDNTEEAKNAIKNLNGKDFQNRSMVVNAARPKKETFTDNHSSS